MLIHRRVSGSIVRSHSSAFYTLPLRNDMWIGVVQWIYKMMWYVKIKALYQQYSTTSRVCCILLRMCSNLWFGPTVNFVPRDGSTKKLKPLWEIGIIYSGLSLYACSEIVIEGTWTCDQNRTAAVTPDRKCAGSGHESPMFKVGVCEENPLWSILC